MEKARESKTVVRAAEHLLEKLAGQFANMSCHGKIHEPEMPKQLRQKD